MIQDAVELSAQPRDEPRVVWVAADSSAGDRVECVALSTAVDRAHSTPPCTFSLMMPTSALVRLGAIGDAAVARAHRIVVCDDGLPAPGTSVLAQSRVGYLPRWFDVDAFAGALAWLSGKQAR